MSSKYQTMYFVWQQGVIINYWHDKHTADLDAKQKGGEVEAKTIEHVVVGGVAYPILAGQYYAIVHNF